MDELSRRHPFSLCHRRREEGGKKGGGHGRIREERKEGKRRRLLKFLSGCYCPWRVFKAGKGSLHRKMALCMLTVTLHSLWGRHRHLNALGDSCNHFISNTLSVRRLWNDFRVWFGWIQFSLTPRYFCMGKKYTSGSALELKTKVDLLELFNNNLISIESTMRKPKTLFYLSTVIGQFYFLWQFKPTQRNNYILS